MSHQALADAAEVHDSDLSDENRRFVKVPLDGMIATHQAKPMVGKPSSQGSIR